jgi:hypothetical protein
MKMHLSVDGGNARFNFPGEYPKHEGDGTAKLIGRDSGVNLSLVLLLFRFIPTAAMPQRYGRPYSLAEPSPSVLLEVSVGKKNHYLRDSELRKMPRSIVTETDPATNQTHVYEGVALDRLVPTKGFNSAGEIVEIEYGFHQIQTISETTVDTRAELIVVDTLDGKPLSRNAPYYFVAKFQRKPSLTIMGVNRVSVKNSPIDWGSTN